MGLLQNKTTKATMEDPFLSEDYDKKGRYNQPFLIIFFFKNLWAWHPKVLVEEKDKSPGRLTKLLKANLIFVKYICCISEKKGFFLPIACHRLSKNTFSQWGCLECCVLNVRSRMHTRTLHGIYLTNNLFSIFLLKKKSSTPAMSFRPLFQL